MSFEYISNHVERGLERILEQFKNKTKVKGLIGSFIKPLQKIEDTLQEILASNDLDNAVGVQLDLFGTIVGLARTFEQSDDDYRDDLKQQIFQNLYSGTPEQVVRAAIFFLGTSDVWYTENYPAEIDVQSEMVLTESQAAIIRAKLEGFLAAGVSLGILGQYDADGFKFFNDADPESAEGIAFGIAHGFGDVEGEVLKVWNQGRIVDNTTAEFEKRGLFGFTRSAKNPTAPYYATINHFTNKIHYLNIKDGIVKTLAKSHNVNSFHYRGDIEAASSANNKANAAWIKTHCLVTTDVMPLPGELLTSTGDKVNCTTGTGLTPKIVQTVPFGAFGHNRDYFATFNVKKKEAKKVRLFIETDSVLKNRVWVDVDLEKKTCTGPRYEVNYDMPWQVGVEFEDMGNAWLKVIIGVNLTQFTNSISTSFKYGMNILGPNGQETFDNPAGDYGVYTGAFSFSFAAYTRGKNIRWSPNGKSIVITKDIDNGAQVAFPIGIFQAIPHEFGGNMSFSFAQVYGQDFSFLQNYPNINYAATFVRDDIVCVAGDGADSNALGYCVNLFWYDPSGSGWSEIFGSLITLNKKAYSIDGHPQPSRSYGTLAVGFEDGTLRVGKINTSGASPVINLATNASVNPQPTDPIKGLVWLPSGDAFLIHTKLGGLFYYDYNYVANTYAVRASLPTGMPTLLTGAPVVDMQCDPINKTISYVFGDQFYNDFYATAAGLMQFNDDYSEWLEITNEISSVNNGVGVVWPGMQVMGHPFLDDENHLTLVAGNGVSFSSGVIVTNGNRMYTTYIEKGEDDQTTLIGPGLSEQY